jgi:hypothetical protein
MVKPWLPDIIEGIVSRVNASFSTRSTDPFDVFFDKGLIAQVMRSVNKADGNFPLVWLVYKFDEQFGKNISIEEEVSFQLIISMPTDNKYTQQQREDITFKPRLLPIYEQLLFEIKREMWFTHQPGQIKHSRHIAPYWGMGATTDTGNLFWQGQQGKFADAIFLTFEGLKIKRRPCAPSGGYPVHDVSAYPITTGQLTFFDDIEIIVGGGEDYDPADDDNSVLIPELIGKDYEVCQRVTGQLRRMRDVEIVQDTVNGGFILANGFKFSQGDTYFIKIRPMYLT